MVRDQSTWAWQVKNGVCLLVRGQSEFLSKDPSGYWVENGAKGGASGDVASSQEATAGVQGREMVTCPRMVAVEINWRS